MSTRTWRLSILALLMAFWLLVGVLVGKAIAAPTGCVTRSEAVATYRHETRAHLKARVDAEPIRRSPGVVYFDRCTDDIQAFRVVFRDGAWRWSFVALQEVRS